MAILLSVCFFYFCVTTFQGLLSALADAQNGP